jgi:hypothetical protein
MISRTGFVAIILVCATLGCASHSRPAKLQDPEAKILWSHRYQYVRIEPREHCDASATAANQHPYSFKSGQLKAILDSMRIDRPDEEKTIPLFSRAEKATLIEPLERAFQQATADEDIGLVIEGAHPGPIGFRNSITTARLFIQNGELQIVFGKLHEPNDEYNTPFHAEPRDYRLYPFFAGSRCEKAGKKFPAIIANNIVRFHDEEGMPRKNWLAVSLVNQPQQPVRSYMPMTAPPAYQASPQSAPPIYQAPRQTAPPAAQDDATRIMPPPVQQPPSTILERLQILKDLRVKGLITEQEYQDKKQEILDSL